MGKMQRQKGHNFEREIAIRFRVVYPEARRHLEYHPADATGIDISHTGPFRIQCKKLRKYAPITCLEEVNCRRDFGDVPALVTAGDFQEPVIVLYLSDFISMLKEGKGTING